MCNVQKIVEIRVRVSPMPISKSCKLAPDKRNNPISDAMTASHVLNCGSAFNLKVGINNPKIGVKNKSKPAIKATLLAVVSVIPHYSKEKE